MFDRPSRNNTVPDSLFKSLGSTQFMAEKLVEIRLSLEIKLRRALRSGKCRNVLIDSFQRPSIVEVAVLPLSHDQAGHQVMNRLTRNIAIPLFFIFNRNKYIKSEKYF